MRILVITSCTGEKRVDSPARLTAADFAQGPEHIKSRERELAASMLPAEEMYTGQQHVRLMRGVAAVRGAQAREKPELRLDLVIVSAGYGVVTGDHLVAPYEMTFQGMGRRALADWANQLTVPADFRAALAQPYDLALILLGDDYLAACDLDGDVHLGGPTLMFGGKIGLSKVPHLEGLRTVPLSNSDARRFSCGLVALKGELASRLLQRASVDPDFVAQVTEAPDPLLILDDIAAPARARRSPPTSKPNVDRVIDLPQSWLARPHRARLSYFIPEWDDLVDRDFDFETDSHSGGSGNWSNEVYAHQLYSEPNYDGILISKVIAEKSRSKKERINRLGVHRFLRVPRQFPIMGDCGAFGYIGEEVPPYSTEEMLDYYTRLDFDFGVSIDHLILTATESVKQTRYELTIENAEEFLREHRKAGLAWTPIGAVQGWDPPSYAAAAKQYVAMGYSYIGLGGLARTPTAEILRILERVHEVVPSTVRIHLFGLARLSAMQSFASLGVRSVDSASLLRRAWMGTGQNYLDIDGRFFAAIRVPEAGKSFRAKRMVTEGRATSDRVESLEARCMQSLARFDRDEVGVDEVLDVLAEYDHLITPERPPTLDLLRRTLEARPWRDCPCDICRRDGIQVVIFRGNNRNRRRGFHNTYVFYRLLQRALAGEQVAFSRGGWIQADQLPLFDSSDTPPEFADAI